MIELRVLGLHALRGPDGHELASLLAQPKRFALLAYLALGEGDGYHRRDTLAAMFWPDLDQFAARRALRNTLYHLRDALGDGVIVTRGDDAVMIDPAVLSCDVRLLRDAVAAGRHAEAVDLYRGELLAGLHLANAGEAFEEWLSAQRASVARLVAGALSALVERERRAGNVQAASAWAERACAFDPTDEGALRRALELLGDAGDTGGALRLYDNFAHRLTAEFDAAPSAETQALAARIRGVGPSADAAVARAAGPGSATPVLPARMPAPHRPRRRLLWAGIGLAAVAAAALLIPRWRRPASSRTRLRVLITVFDNRTGDPALQALGRMAQDWLAEGIARARLVDVVDPRSVFVQTHQAAGATVDARSLARRTGAGLIVSGSFDRTGDTLFVQAAVTDAGSGRIVRAVGPILATVRDPVGGLDELRSRVTTALASVVDRHAAHPIDEDDIPPFDAYEAYVEGWDTYWHGDTPRAESLFLSAAHRDTAFIAAALAVAVAAANSSGCARVDSLAHALDARRPALSRVDRLTLQIADARCRGRNGEMLQLTLERADLEPGNASDLMSAAAAALWADRPQQALALLQRVNPAVDLAWSTDTTHFAYWSGITEALHELGRHHKELDAARRMPSGAPLSRVWFVGSALAALSRPAEAVALLDSSASLPVETSADLGLAPYTDGRPQYTVTFGWVADWIARELAYHGDPIAARQAAARAVAWYRTRPPGERAAVEERLVEAWSLEMTGDFPHAEQVARTLAAEDSLNVDFRGELAGLAAERGDTALADSLDRWLAAQPPARVGWSASIYRARIAALLGRPDSAVARTREAFDEGMWPRWLHQEPALAPLRTRADFSALIRPRQ